MSSKFSIAQDSLPKKQLKEIIISESNPTPTQINLVKIDSFTLKQYSTTTLQNLLALHSNVFIKNYGISSLSTISIRGSSAAQTTLQWHGVAINNAMTGLSDFSLIPSGLFDKVQIQYGHEQDESSIGGSIILQNEKPIFKKDSKAKINLGFESLLNSGALLEIKKSSAKIVSATKIFTYLGRNRFKFFNPEKNAKDTLTHSNANQVGITHDMHFKLNAKHVMSWYNWVQIANREIPPATFEWISAKEEKMVSFRSLVQSEKKFNRHLKLNSSFAVILDSYQYDDSIQNLNTSSKAITLPFQSTFSAPTFSNQTILISLHGTYSQLINQYKSQSNQIGLKLNYKIKDLVKNSQLEFTWQQEQSNRFKIPWTGNITWTMQAKKSLKFYTTLSKQVRIPTLNELFFEPGGNTNLKPESSRNIEGGFQSIVTKKNWNLNYSISLFSRRVQNWIAWFGNSILTPRNIQEVGSYGLDMMAFANSAMHRERLIQQINMGFFYAYTISATRASIIPNDFSIGKQIPYVPRYQAKGKLGISFKDIQLELWQTYTGYRFVTTDESQFLKPYFTTNLFSHFLLTKNKSLQCNVRLNNLFNQQFESIVGRIMPGRNLSLGFQYALN